MSLCTTGVELVSLLKELGTSLSEEIEEKQTKSLYLQLLFFSQAFKKALVSCGKCELAMQVLIFIAPSVFAGYQRAHGCCRALRQDGFTLGSTADLREDKDHGPAWECW